jgi:hypothetical protein
MDMDMEVDDDKLMEEDVEVEGMNREMNRNAKVEEDRQMEEDREQEGTDGCPGA